MGHREDRDLATRARSAHRITDEFDDVGGQEQPRESYTAPDAKVGAGVGIFQGAQFLGAGAGPAVFGVLLSILQTSGAGPVNPFYTGKVPAYSDTFLALTLVAALAMIAALRLRSARATLPSTGAR